MTQIISKVAEWRRLKPKGTLGFVPTMGALHEGHLSLIRRAKAENDHVLVSIFVNPTQFDQESDLTNYPRVLEQDLTMLRAVGADFLFTPEYDELYRDRYRYKVIESKLSHELCGAHRPGHFDGVLTVVMKLLNIAGADRAYFGEKDYQQYELIRGMTESLFLQTQIIGCPTIRESDGLAMSSRNRMLSTEDRARAPEFVKALLSARTPGEAKAALYARGFEVDYVEDRGSRRYGAVRVGRGAKQVRLIDNVAIPAEIRGETHV